jgi:hypothetical protein
MRPLAVIAAAAVTASIVVAVLATSGSAQSGPDAHLPREQQGATFKFIDVPSGSGSRPPPTSRRRARSRASVRTTRAATSASAPILCVRLTFRSRSRRWRRRRRYRRAPRGGTAIRRYARCGTGGCPRRGGRLRRRPARPSEPRGAPLRGAACSGRGVREGRGPGQRSGARRVKGHRGSALHPLRAAALGAGGGPGQAVVGPRGHLRGDVHQRDGHDDRQRRAAGHLERPRRRHRRASVGARRLPGRARRAVARRQRARRSVRAAGVPVGVRRLRRRVRADRGLADGGRGDRRTRADGGGGGLRAAAGRCRCSPCSSRPSCGRRPWASGRRSRGWGSPLGRSRAVCSSTWRVGAEFSS